MARRLLLTYLGLTLVVCALLEVPLAISYRQRLDSDLASDLVRDAFSLASYVEEAAEGIGTTDLQAVAANYTDTTGARVVIVDRSGQLLADSRPEAGSTDFSSRPEIMAALAGEVATGTRRSETLGTDLLYAAVPIASKGEVHGAIRITYATEQLTSRWHKYLITLVSIAAVCLLAAALLGVLFARWVARPLSRLEHAAEAIGDGELAVRAPTDAGPPEVKKLAVAFNTMASEIDQLVRSQQAFVADASHQLRSPLAALRLRLENVQADVVRAGAIPVGASGAALGPPDDPATSQLADDLDAALAETNRLSRIIDGLLALARADRAGTGAGATRRTLSVADLLEDRRLAWRPFASGHGVEVEVEPVTISVVADEDRLAQALDNLLANAIDVLAATGGHVRLHAMPTAFADEPNHAGQGYVDIHVTDDGPGMTAEERAHAFDRFWRARRDTGREAQQETRTGGSGLGLAIARKLVNADEGELVLLPAEGGGLDAVVRMPASI